jgi:hypothetical protein
MLSTYDKSDSQQNVSHSSSLSHNKRSKINSSRTNYKDYIYPDNVIINSLDIADGLKELLIKYGFTFKELLTMSISELTERLSIDLYVASIICDAAKKLSSSNNLEGKIAQVNSAYLY